MKIHTIQTLYKHLIFFFLTKIRVKSGSIKDTYLTSRVEVQPTDRLSHGHSNEPKAIVHIRVTSGVRTRIRRIEFISLKHHWTITSGYKHIMLRFKLYPYSVSNSI